MDLNNRKITNHPPSPVLIYINNCSGSGAHKNVLSGIIAIIRCYVYKMLGINSTILLHLYVNSVKYIFFNNISSKFRILTYNNQIFKNCFVNIHYHLTKVSSRINKCRILHNSLQQYPLYGMPTLGRKQPSQQRLKNVTRPATLLKAHRFVRGLCLQF